MSTYNNKSVGITYECTTELINKENYSPDREISLCEVYVNLHRDQFDKWKNRIANTKRLHSAENNTIYLGINERPETSFVPHEYWYDKTVGAAFYVPITGGDVK